MALVKTENLTFSYPECEESALKDVSIEVDSGEFVLIFGPSGSGKSTLLKNLFPGIEPFGTKSGRVLIDGREMGEDDRREVCERMGYVGQNVEAQIITDRVWHEMAFTLENLGYSDSRMKSRIAEIASYFSLTDWLDRKTDTLSGGEKQKLNLAVSMLTFPDVLILDEPVSQLDPVMKDEFLSLLKKINRDYGVAIIMCEHDLSGALEMADRCILMEEGRITKTAEPGEMVSHLIDSGYLEYLPDSIRAGYSLFGRREILNVRDMKKLIRNASFRYVERENAVRSSEPAAALKNVWFRHERKSRDVLRDLSVSVSRGEIVSVVGPNGSGKTTLLSVMAGVIRPYKGKVRTFGKVSMLPQRPVSLFIKNTVREDFENLDGDYMKYVRRFSLENVLEKHPYDLSGGEIELCAVIKVLMSSPDILLLDEPTKGIDRNCRKLLGKMLQELNSQGMTIVITSHDMEFCARYTDRTAVMFDGDIVDFSENRNVLSDNYFYTTEINRIFKEKDRRILLLEEVERDD